MNIDVTIIGQIIIFLIFVAFTMKFVWPPIQVALEERQKTIADGLNAAEQGKKELERAGFESKRILQEARTQATSIIEGANHRAHQIEEKAQVDAHKKADKIKEQAQSELEQNVIEARKQIRDEVGKAVVSSASKLIQTELKDNAKMHQEIFNQLAKELEE
jgi:F-type H+-transporting ATPase subunit b